MHLVFLATVFMLDPTIVASGILETRDDVAHAADAGPRRGFRGVFRHKGLVKSINIIIDSLPAEPARLNGVLVHVEQGCFDYTASGYVKGSQIVLLPIGDSLKYRKEGRRFAIELHGEERVRQLEELGQLEFDIASLVCHLDAERQIQKVDIVLPDMTIYHVQRDLKTPHDP